MMAASPSSPAKRKRSTLDFAALPTEVLQLIAFHLVLETAAWIDPTSTKAARRDGKEIEPYPAVASTSALGINSRADMKASLGPRPYAKDEEFWVPRPSALQPLLRTCKTTWRALRFDGNEPLYQKLYLATFDAEAVLRRYGRGSKRQPLQPVPSRRSSQVKTKVDDLLNSPEDSKASGKVSADASQRNGASEPAPSLIPRIQRMLPASVRRSSLGSQMLNFHMDEDMDGAAAPSSRSLDLLDDPRLLAEEYRERWAAIKRMQACAAKQSLDVPGVARREDALKDMWTAWWMVSENDGKNLRILKDYVGMCPYMLIRYTELFVKEAMEPGYPHDSLEKALTGSLCLHLELGKDREKESESIDELLFVHRPWVFACHKYQQHIAPWIFRVLPLTQFARDQEELQHLAARNPFMDDLTPRKLAVETERFGRIWEVVLPSTSESSSVQFMSMLDRHPQLLGLVKNPEAPLLSPLGKYIPTSSPLGSVNSLSGASPSSYFPPVALAGQTLSEMTDQDWVQSLTCIDPVDSPGLPPLFYRHRVEGIWQGKYVYLDHPAYQTALSGNIRSIYDGAFGEQEMEFFCEEVVINVRKEQVGGTTSPLYAGFRSNEAIEHAWEREEGTAEQRGWEICRDENAPDRPGWTKEIMIKGHGRTAWGEFTINGRVRSWDGLLTLMIQYNEEGSIGKWHFRSYLRGGDFMTGRWRETFIKENTRGYEGPWIMYKADGAAYRERRKEKAALLRAGPPPAGPFPPPGSQHLQGPAGRALPSIQIPSYRPHPARSMHGVAPTSHEYMLPRSRDPAYTPTLYSPGSKAPFDRPWDPASSRIDRSVSPTYMPSQSLSPATGYPAPSRGNILPPIIDPSGDQGSPSRRLSSTSSRPRQSSIHDASEVSDIWSRSLASGSRRGTEDDHDMSRRSTEAEIPRKRPWDH